MIQLKDITKTYQNGSVKSHALKGINMRVSDGEILVLLGQSGSGKSTLLNLCSGLDKPTSGLIMMDETDFTSLTDQERTKYRRKHMGFIFQDYHLLPTLTVKENILVGGDVVEDTYEIDEILKFVNLHDHQDKFPHMLSGGEQQRVSIARAIIKKPNILFCDEPTGALDAESGFQILEQIERLHKEYKTSILLITHNQALKALGHRVVYLQSGEIIKIEDQEPISVADLKERMNG